MICMLRRWSCKKPTGKPLNIHCSGLPADRANQVSMLDLLRRLSFKGHTGNPLHICSGLPGDRASARRFSSMTQSSSSPKMVMNAKLIPLYQDKYDQLI